MMVNVRAASFLSAAVGAALARACSGRRALGVALVGLGTLGCDTPEASSEADDRSHPALNGEGPASGAKDDPVVDSNVIEPSNDVVVYEEPCGDSARPLTAPDCPTDKPEVSECFALGQHCLYPGATEGCVQRVECALGLWSPHEEECPSESPPLESTSPAGCPDMVPIDRTPCAEEDLHCRYGVCAQTDGFLVDCRCGRWRVEEAMCFDLP